MKTPSRFADAAPRSSALRVIGRACSLSLACATAAFAQDFPAKTIRVIDGYPAGGGTDVIARLMAPKLASLIGQSVIVENRAGASGTIAATAVVRAPADGYTLLMGVSSTIAVMPSLISDLPYDTLRDLTAVAQLVTYPSVLVVHPSIPASNVKELIALAKTRPGALNYASGGIGTANHLGAELFKSMAKVNITHVGYKGGAPALIAVLSGEADLLFSTMPAAAAHLRNGRFRALAVTGPQRSALVPDVPTVSEAGLPGFEVVTWSGLLAPAKTPREVIARLNKSVNAAMGDPDVRARIADQATDVVIGSPEQFSAVMRKDSERWAKLIREAGIRAE